MTDENLHGVAAILATILLARRMKQEGLLDVEMISERVSEHNSSRQGTEQRLNKLNAYI
jgi:hypothetical protein